MSPKELSWIEKTIDFLNEKGPKSLYQICDMLGIKNAHNTIEYVPVQMALVNPLTEGKVVYSAEKGLYYVAEETI